MKYPDFFFYVHGCEKNEWILMTNAVLYTCDLDTHTHTLPTGLFGKFCNATMNDPVHRINSRKSLFKLNVKSELPFQIKFLKHCARYLCHSSIVGFQNRKWEVNDGMFMSSFVHLNTSIWCHLLCRLLIDLYQYVFNDEIISRVVTHCRNVS